MNINLNENTKTKIEKIRLQFEKETEEELSLDDFIKLSVEALYEEVDACGTGRMFLRIHLWKKNVIYLSGKDGIIGSQ